MGISPKHVISSLEWQNWSAGEWRLNVSHEKGSKAENKKTWQIHGILLHQKCLESLSKHIAITTTSSIFSCSLQPYKRKVPRHFLKSHCPEDDTSLKVLLRFLTGWGELQTRGGLWTWHGIYSIRWCSGIIQRSFLVHFLSQHWIAVVAISLCLH